MSSTYTSNDLVNAIAAASKNLSARKDEVNRLNVFPVPDGDTGTNMSARTSLATWRLPGMVSFMAFLSGSHMRARNFCWQYSACNCADGMHAWRMQGINTK